MGLVPDPLANNREKPMTLTTTMIATSPIDPMRVFLHAAKLLGANEGYDFHINEHRINAKLGQGLPALLWVSHNESKLLAPGEYWTNDPWDKRLAGPEPEVIYRPRGYVDIYFDTVHGYGKSDGFGGLHYDEGYGGPHDLHAWLVREMASYFTAQGVGYWWQHEYTGEWFNTLEKLSILGDPELGGKNPVLRHQVNVR